MGYLIMLLLLFFAFLSGIITVLSPCVLPVLPLLLSAGLGQGKLRPYGIIAGLIASFTVFTLTLTALVQATGISPDILRYISLSLIILFGLTLIFPRLEHLFARLAAPLTRIGNSFEKSGQSKTGFVSGLLLGSALGLVWAPCAGPILATITTLVATNAVTWQAVLVTLAYSFGTALPMFLIISGSKTVLSYVQKITPYTETIRKFFGLLMIVSALAIALHLDVTLQQMTLKYFPSLKIEDNQLVKNELDSLLALDPTFKESPIPTIGALAPEFKGIISWINSPELTLKELNGKVVLVDFWTYSCINCVRTLPYLKKWYETYKDQGFVIIGVHTPEFEFEKSLSNVQNAVSRFGITYPIALDSRYATWKNYHNRYWPAHYLIDQKGIIKSIHFGEGNYVSTENNIRELLGLNPVVATEPKRSAQELTPEIYLGYKRAANYSYDSHLAPNATKMFTWQRPPDHNHVSLQGQWHALADGITSKSNESQLTLNFTAGNVYLVMSAERPSVVHVKLNNKAVPQENSTIDMNDTGVVKITEARMYHLLDRLSVQQRNSITLTVPEGVTLYAFTFGA